MLRHWGDVRLARRPQGQVPGAIRVTSGKVGPVVVTTVILNG